MVKFSEQSLSRSLSVLLLFGFLYAMSGIGVSVRTLMRVGMVFVVKVLVVTLSSVTNRKLKLSHLNLYI